MPDIELRFHKDMLVLSTPLEGRLAQQGVDVDRDLEFHMLLENERIQDYLRLDQMAGVQCMVAPGTRRITRSQLLRRRMEDRADELAETAIDLANSVNPQHVLVEVGPCGLPLDGSSKASLNENRAQYAQAARLFAGKRFDAFFLNGFCKLDDMKCALMGLSQASGASVFVSVDVDEGGTLAGGRGSIEDAAAVAAEFGAAVFGFKTAANIQIASVLCKRVAAVCDLPLLVQLEVHQRNPHAFGPTDENPYYCADTMVEAALSLRAEGAQFLRAVGQATPAYAAVLAATVQGLDAAILTQRIRQLESAAAEEDAKLESEPTDLADAAQEAFEGASDDGGEADDEAEFAAIANSAEPEPEATKISAFDLFIAQSRAQVNEAMRGGKGSSR